MNDVDRGIKRLWYCVLSGMVSVVILNLYHPRFALRDSVAFWPLSNLYAYEAPVDDWRALSYVFLYLAGAFIAGGFVVEIYHALKRTLTTRLG